MIYGVNAHLASPELLRRVLDLGGTFVRLDFNWVELEPQRDQYHWEITDPSVYGARDLGLRVYPSLGYSPPWANGGRAREYPPTNREYYWNFVANAVQRYREVIQDWGLWNEPNQPGFWQGSLSQYVNLILQPGWEAVKAVEPAARVCGPELTREGNWRYWLRNILRRGGQYLDVTTQHVYDTPGRAVVEGIREVMDVLRDLGFSERPLAITETGWNSARVGEEAQAANFDQLFEAFQQALNPVAFLAYQLVDEPGPDKWGLLREDWSWKPAAHVFARYAHQAPLV